MYDIVTLCTTFYYRWPLIFFTQKVCEPLIEHAESLAEAVGEGESCICGAHRRCEMAPVLLCQGPLNRIHALIRFFRQYK